MLSRSLQLLAMLLCRHGAAPAGLKCTLTTEQQLFKSLAGGSARNVQCDTDHQFIAVWQKSARSLTTGKYSSGPSIRYWPSSVSNWLRSYRSTRTNFLFSNSASLHRSTQCFRAMASNKHMPRQRLSLQLSHRRFSVQACQCTAEATHDQWTQRKALS